MELKAGIKGIVPIFLFSVLCSLFPDLAAQTSTSSPYSRFGLGEFSYAHTPYFNGLGGLGFALQNDSTAPYYLNTLNPAGLSSVKLTTFDLALFNTTNRINSGTESVTANRFALGRLAMGMPMNRKNTWGMAFGLQPFSSVGYNISSEEEIDSIGTVRYNYQGSGGINDLFLGTGFRIKNLSIGASASYLFGGITSMQRDSFPSTGMYFNTRVQKTVHFNNFLFKGGAQYLIRFGKWSLGLGATATIPVKFTARTTTLAELLKFNSLIEIARDTALFIEDEEQVVEIPLSLGGGFVLKKGEKILFGVDYFTQNWSSNDLLGQTGKFTTASRISAGFQYVPDKYSDGRSNYKKRINYRAGFSLSNSYLVLSQDVPITEMSFSLGLGLPLRKMRAGDTFTQNILNLSIELGQRGTLESDLVKEQFIKVNFGFSINEKWFVKRKYD